MGSVIASTCTLCGNMHDFYLRDSDSIDGNATYRFECPNLRSAGTINFPQEWGEVAPSRPEHAVSLSRVSGV
jgi:hypothetical protein